jgi:23S rRNA pseudouridine1911/1915/1917 synthase
MFRYIVPSSDKKWTLYSFLRSHGISLTLWRKIKKTGKLLVNNAPVLPHTTVKPGDEVRVFYDVASSVMPADLPLCVKYEDEYILIVEKPAGMLVHPIGEERTNSLGNAVIHYYLSQNKHYGFHPVLRLDRNTSGLVLIAKHPYIQHLLSNKEENTIEKQYLAIVSGHPEPRSGIIDAPIARNPGSIILRMVDPSGRHAQTRYRVVTDFSSASLVEIQLVTGRTHQIRVHFSYIGHPLLGDDLYGGSTSSLSRQALHASRLSFIHPISRQPVDIKSALPDDLTELIQALSLNSSKNPSIL